MVLTSQIWELNAQLYKAVQLQDHACMVEALSQGADANFASSLAHHVGMLHIAAGKNDLIGMNILLTWGARINDEDMSNESALLYALCAGHLGAAEWLLEAGANPSARSADGRAAEDIAFQGTHMHLDVRETVYELLEKFRTHLPRITSLKQRDTLNERLFEYNQEGYAPLDSPHTWSQFGAIGNILLEEGMPLTKEDLLSINARGKRWIDIAVSARAFGEVANHLRRQGEYFELDELIDREGHRTEFLDHLCANGAAKYIFHSDLLPCCDIQDVKKLYHALPDTVKPEISNYQTLCAKVQSRVDKQHSSRNAGVGL